MKPWLDDQIASNGKPVHENFSNWFAESKVLDDLGNPLVVYHGTTTCFDTFIPGDGNKLRGMYFSDDEFDARQWAERAGASETIVLPVFLSIERPATDEDIDHVWPKLMKRFGREPTPKELTSSLQRLGFDGYIDESNYMEGMEFVAFRPDQIKIASGNIGLYAKMSESIADLSLTIIQQVKNSRKAIRSIEKPIASRSRNAP